MLLMLLWWSSISGFVLFWLIWLVGESRVRTHVDWGCEGTLHPVWHCMQQQRQLWILQQCVNRSYNLNILSSRIILYIYIRIYICMCRVSWRYPRIPPIFIHFHNQMFDIRHKRGWEQLLDNEAVHLLLSTYYSDGFLACGGGGDFVLPNTSTQLEWFPPVLRSLLLDPLIYTYTWHILEEVCSLTRRGSKQTSSNRQLGVGGLIHVHVSACWCWGISPCT